MTEAPDLARPMQASRVATVLLLAVWLSACAAVASPSKPVVPVQAQTANPRFDAWADSFAADWVRLSPERATSTQYFSGAEQAALDGQLNPGPELRSRQEQALAQTGLNMLKRYLAGSLAGPLSSSQRTAAATMQWSLQRRLAEAPFEDYSFAFNQRSGLQVRSVNLLTQSHPMRKPGDVQSYLSRLAQLADRVDEEVARTRKVAAKGVLPPRFILERGRDQIEAFLQPVPSDNLFVSALARRTERMAGLSAQDRSQALRQAQSLVSERVQPAFARALALLNELHPRTTEDAGLWRLPNGAAAYAQALAGNTTTQMTAEEIHAVGLREVARVEAQMDQVLKDMGRSSGTVRERISALQAELQPPASPDPRSMLLARYSAYVREAQQRAAPLFNITPRAPVEVQRVPALTERTSSAYYTTPTPDGSRPGIFWAPLPGPSFNILGMKTLAVHEAVPGHHFQLALQQEQRSLPRWRQQRIFSGGSAHSEGWALYAEQLAIEQGWYAGEATSLLGALNAQLFRARRLVVDTGLHARRWTRQQAIDYGISASEVERYVVNPGQATAYMIGMLHILKLREQAQTQLGAKFRLPDFHDLVLKTGSVPLDVLSGVVEDWIEAGGGAV